MQGQKLTVARILALGALTLFLVAMLGFVRPFERLNDFLSSKSMPMQPALQDPRLWADGDDLRPSLQTRPLLPPQTRQILIMGNSQQYTCSVAKGEKPRQDHRAILASDLLAAKLNSGQSASSAVYNSSVPNQTFVEELWQGIYWFRVSPRRPAVLILQSSFDTFRKLGIRPGFQTLLGDPAFAEAQQQFASPGQSYYNEFIAARSDFEKRKLELGTANGKMVTTEGLLRSVLEKVPLYRDREKERGSFLDILYVARVFALGISPTTRRHILGQPLEENFTALRDLIRLARSSGCRVFIYNGPVNPAVSMFFEDEYRAYLKHLRALAASESSQFEDLSSAVPSMHWGYWVNGPDPIHFNEQGHQVLAERLYQAFGPALLEP